MDPLSISAAVAGFLSPAVQITELLRGYINGIQSASEEAKYLLTQVAALCYVREKLVEFLRSEGLRGRKFD
jgi:hypothetical protein